MGERERNRCRDRIDRIAHAGLDTTAARLAVIAELRRAIGFSRWCWPLTDPDSGLAMSGIGEFDFAPSLRRLVGLEEYGDVTSKPRLIVGERAASTLSAATRGDLSLSRRWRECLQPYGIGDELMTACRDRYGCWGSVELMRDSDDGPFSDDDVRLLEALAPTLGSVVRAGVVRDISTRSAAAGGAAPGTLILDESMSPIGWSAPATDWLAELGGGPMLPPAVYEIGARVLTPTGHRHHLPPRVRVQTLSGRWCVIEGARLEGDASPRVVITIRPTTADEVFDFLCKAHGLTGRERQLVTLVKGGLATAQLARALGISPYTVQDHLKAIFDKTGVRSRRELMSHLAGRIADV